MAADTGKRNLLWTHAQQPLLAHRAIAGRHLTVRPRLDLADGSDRWAGGGEYLL